MRFNFVLILLLTAALPALCQDLVTVAPQAAEVVFENARVRVVRLHIAPKASLPMHDRPARVVIPLTANDVSITRSDNTTSVVRTAAGNAAWSEPTRRSVTNLDASLENIVVELKGAVDPARPLAHPPIPLPPGYLDERFHHWFFENQYVRVYDVRIPPGATTDFHVHAFDSVFIQVSGGLTAEQKQGQAWGKAERDLPGAVKFSADAKQPRTHRVRNEGTAEYQVIVVQLLQ
jgi:tRNA threonylcarbamoyladenosine modification (KEOPS) complex  Pcc1 subunit